MADATGLREAARTRYSAVFDEASRILGLALMDAAPLGETGDTRRGIQVEPDVASETAFGATVRSTGKGGDYVEEGQTAHDIFPIHGQALRFMGGQMRIGTPSPNQRISTRAGGVVFAKVVHHPAVPARPWFAPTLERWPDLLAQAAANV